MSQPQRRLKAAYHTRGPFNEPVTYNKCEMREKKDANGKLVARELHQERVTEEKEVYYVHFPQGHSIRVGRVELERLGFHIKPRIVDMDTGDVVDIGGDPYDFGNDPYRDQDIALMEDDKPSKKKPASSL